LQTSSEPKISEDSIRRQETLEKEPLESQTPPSNPTNELISPVEPLSSTSSLTLSDSPAANPRSSDSSAVKPSPQFQILNSHFSILNEAVTSSSALPARGSLEHRVSQYTLDRHLEALHGKDPTKVGKHAARSFKSKMQWCPCGHQLPCPEHGDFPKHFWELSPDNAEYLQILQRKNLPFTAPHLFLKEKERELARSQMTNSQFSFLISQSRAHAISRYRSHTRRPPGTPPPDESWTEQCPCGAQHPCDLHPDLWSEVRYLRPWDPDYIAALERHSVPVYTPTPEEIQPPSPSSPPSSKTLSETLSNNPGIDSSSTPDRIMTGQKLNGTAVDLAAERLTNSVVETSTSASIDRSEP